LFFLRKKRRCYDDTKNTSRYDNKASAVKFESNKKDSDAGAKAPRFHESPMGGINGASGAGHDFAKENPFEVYDIYMKRKFESDEKASDAGSKALHFHESPARKKDGASYDKKDADAEKDTANVRNTSAKENPFVIYDMYSRRYESYKKSNGAGTKTPSFHEPSVRGESGASGAKYGSYKKSNGTGEKIQPFYEFSVRGFEGASRAKKDTEVEKETINAVPQKKPLTLKQRVLKYIVYTKPLRGRTCVLCTALLFATLVLFNFLPSGSLTEHAFDLSTISQIKNGSDPIFTAAFTGDIMLGRSVRRAAQFYGYDMYFERIKEYWNGFDIVMGNFNTPLVSSDDDYIVADKEFNVSSDPMCLPAVKNAGYTLLGLANSHMMDFDKKALEFTLDTLDKEGITHVGAGRNIKESLQYTLQEYNGVKVAVIAVTDIVNNVISGVKGFSATEHQAGVLSTRHSNPSYLDAVASAKEEADVVIVFMHWGDEYTTIISDSQRDIGKKLIDAGADFVIGSHAHIIQPAEIYRGKVIFYGLGNFVMDQGWNRTKDSVLLRMCLDKKGNNIFEAIPLRLENAAPAETDNPLFTRRIFRTLTKKLDSDQYKIENNRLYVFPSKLTFKHHN